jgi:hypothetical protein
MAAAVPHRVVDRAKNAGLSLMTDDNRALRCPVTSETTQYHLGALFANFLAGMALAEKEGEDDNPNVEVVLAQGLESLHHEGKEAGEKDMQGGVSLERSHRRGTRCCIRGTQPQIFRSIPGTLSISMKDSFTCCAYQLFDRQAAGGAPIANDGISGRVLPSKCKTRLLQECAWPQQ